MVLTSLKWYFKKRKLKNESRNLSGGLGTRLSEYTKKIPKPMVAVSGKPIIYYIMKHYSNYGFTNFIIASGYKQNVIKKIL